MLIDVTIYILLQEELIDYPPFNEFSNDEKTRSAVVWKIEVIGEATKNIPKDIRAKYANLPWKEMAKMRDKIAHFYFGIDNNIVWKVVKNRLPEIMPKVERMLAELDIPDAQSIITPAQIGTSGGDEGEGYKEQSNEK